MGKPLVVETSIDAADIKAAAETCDDNDQRNFESVLADLVHKKEERKNFAKGGS